MFADTVYYVAVVNPRDALHHAARTFAGGYTGRTVTTEFVLVEVANFLGRANGRPAFRDLVRDLRSAPQVEIIPASTELSARGFELFVARPDKTLVTNGLHLVRRHGRAEDYRGSHGRRPFRSGGLHAVAPPDTLK